MLVPASLFLWRCSPTSLVLAAQVAKVERPRLKQSVLASGHDAVCVCDSSGSYKVVAGVLSDI